MPNWRLPTSHPLPITVRHRKDTRLDSSFISVCIILARLGRLLWVTWKRWTLAFEIWLSFILWWVQMQFKIKGHNPTRFNHLEIPMVWVGSLMNMYNSASEINRIGSIRLYSLPKVNKKQLHHYVEHLLLMRQ